MPSDKPVQRLNDILENIDWIFQYTKGFRLRNFVEDRQARDAVERCLLRIAEAARKLEGVVEKLAPISHGRTSDRLVMPSATSTTPLMRR